LEERIMFDKLTVRECMTPVVVSISPYENINTAYNIMREYGIRHLPVVEQAKVVGIISSGDVREARPSDATSLSIWEVNYLWEKIRVNEAMTQKVVTVGADAILIDAIKLMVAHKFSSLPVVVDDRLVGILTETDIFNLIIESTEKALKA
jgi:acetoin utilization protein AcuB